MKLIRTAGVVVVLLLGVAAIGVLVAPSVVGQTRRGDRDVVVAPHVEVFGAGSTIGVSVAEVAQSDVAKNKLAAPGGALIEDVRQGTPAEKAGVRAGDVVVEFDGERVRSAAQFGRLVRETPSGRTVKMAVLRGGQKTTLDITPEGRDAWSSSFNFAPDIATMVGDRMSRLGRDLETRLGDLRFDLAVTPGRGRLGVTLQELSPQLADYFGTKDGVLVSTVREDSPAATAGVKAGDVITAIGDRTIASVSDVTRAVANAGDGELTIKVVRDKKELTFKTKLEPAERRSRRVFRMVH